MSGLLDGKKILVTGAARGIGFAIASSASKAGARVAINDLTAEMADKAVVSITKSGGEACAAPGDVSARGGASEIVNQAADALGGLDGLVNNAGMTHFTDHSDHDGVSIADRDGNIATLFERGISGIPSPSGEYIAYLERLGESAPMDIWLEKIEDIISVKPVP